MGAAGQPCPCSLPTSPVLHRERMDLKAPIYFSTGLTEKANHYYKLFIPWTNQKIRKTFVQRNMFEFKHIKAFDRAFADSPGPMVRPIAGWGGVLLGRGPAGKSRRGAGRLCAGKTSGQKAEGRGASDALTVPHLPRRSCLPHQGCCMPASPYRSSGSGQGTRRTW